MGSVGDAYDNAMAESFFATLECELLERRRFKTQVEARMTLFAFIEGFYNPRRRHSALRYLSPVAFERRHAIMAQKRSLKIYFPRRGVIPGYNLATTQRWVDQIAMVLR
jgi:putative transposase